MPRQAKDGSPPVAAVELDSTGNKAKKILRKRWLTAGEAACIFGVSATTVNRWSEIGLLPCTRMPSTKKAGDDGDRRYDRRHLLVFAQEHGFHLRLPMVRPLIVAYQASAAVKTQLADLMTSAWLGVQHLTNPVRLGILIERCTPLAVVLDFGAISSHEGTGLVQELKGGHPWAALVKTLVILGPDNESPALQEALRSAGADFIYTESQLPALVADLERLLYEY